MVNKIQNRQDDILLFTLVIIIMYKRKGAGKRKRRRRVKKKRRTKRRLLCGIRCMSRGHTVGDCDILQLLLLPSRGTVSTVVIQ